MSYRKYTEYDAEVFRRKVQETMTTIHRLLQASAGSIRDPSSSPPEYALHFGMARQWTQSSHQALGENLRQLVGTSEYEKLLDTVTNEKHAVELEFVSLPAKCEFVREQLVEVTPSSHSVKSETVSTTTPSRSLFGTTTTTKTERSIVQKFPVYHWKVGVAWELALVRYPAASPTDRQRKVVLQRDTSTILQTQSKRPPNTTTMHAQDSNPISVSLGWFLNYKQSECTTDAVTTPRRQPFVLETLAWTDSFHDWAGKVHDSLLWNQELANQHNPPQPSTVAVPDLQQLDNIRNVFNPILPFWKETENNTPAEQHTLAPEELQLLHDEHKRSLEAVLKSLANNPTFGPPNLAKLLSTAEASLYFLILHFKRLIENYYDTMNELEFMLQEQLVSAIGKRVTAEDVDAFCQYHLTRFLHPPPLPFCQVIRRPHHTPEGLLSIEAASLSSSLGRSKGTDDTMQPISTIVRQIEPSTVKVQVPLNAATSVELAGDVYLHGWLRTQFPKSGDKTYQLIARARQFSCFILVVGTVMSSQDGTEQILQPKDAIILQNKDEVIIPLLLETLPTPKEFRDALKSLSAEQQRFAQAFRNMQLESSLMGVAVLDIKPQLEALLGLESNSLTKEIQLTQHLLELCLEYQIPTDLVSYDGIPDASAAAKLERVQSHVDRVMQVIEAEKKSQLQDQTLRAEMAYEHAFEEQPMMMAYGAAEASTVPVMQRSVAMEGRRRPMASSSGSRPEKRMMKKSKASRVRPSRPLAPHADDDSAQVDLAASNDMYGKADASTEAPGGNAQKIRRTSTELSTGSTVDISALPKLLDQSIEKHDRENSVRSTIIKSSSSNWTRIRQANLLSKPQERRLDADMIRGEKNKAFDLLDALSQSGSMPISFSQVHVFVAATHCFEKDVIETVVQDNINPIEKLEVSTLLLASAIHGVPAGDLIANSRDRLRLTSSYQPLLGPTTTSDSKDTMCDESEK